MMQTIDGEMPWFRILRAVALMLTVVLGLEMTLPLGGYAQPNQEPASTPVVSVSNQELPPMQEAEVIEERKPYYKKWWFWTIVGVVVAGGAAAAALSGGGGSSSRSAPDESGNVQVKF
jgi:hypothetical protein